jgi:hypothetical protein
MIGVAVQKIAILATLCNSAIKIRVLKGSIFETNKPGYDESHRWKMNQTHLKGIAICDPELHIYRCTDQ